MLWVGEYIHFILFRSDFCRVLGITVIFNMMGLVKPAYSTYSVIVQEEQEKIAKELDLSLSEISDKAFKR